MAHLMLSAMRLAAISLGLSVSGFVSRLPRFAVSTMAAAVEWFLPPAEAAPTLLALSTCNQLLPAGALHREILWIPKYGGEGAPPHMLGGLIGPAATLIRAAVGSCAFCALADGFPPHGTYSAADLRGVAGGEVPVLPSRATYARPRPLDSSRSTSTAAMMIEPMAVPCQ